MKIFLLFIILFQFTATYALSYSDVFSKGKASKSDVFKPLTPEEKELEKAILNNDLSKMKNLLQSGKVNVNKLYDFSTASVYNSDRFPIHWAAREGRVEAVKLLLEGGAHHTPRIPDPAAVQQNPLEAAINNGHVEVAKALVEAGLDVNVQDSTTKGNALHKSLSNLKNLALVDFFIKHGVDVKAVDRNKNTALHLLAESMVSQNKKHIFFSGSGTLAETDAYKKTLTPDNVNESFMKRPPLKPKLAEAIQNLIQAGVDPNARNNANNTALHILSQVGNRTNLDKTAIVQAVEALIQNGANVNAQDSKGYTPLDIAKTKKRNRNIIKVFVQAGARRGAGNVKLSIFNKINRSKAISKCQKAFESSTAPVKNLLRKFSPAL